MYRLNIFKEDEKAAFDVSRDECFQAIKKSKESYLLSLGNKLVDKNQALKHIGTLSATLWMNEWIKAHGYLPS